MSISSITDQLSNARLTDDQLLFNPPPHLRIPDSALDNIPRFLFRTVGPLSRGTADDKWMRSEAAAEDKPSSREDIFNPDQEEQHVAGMLSAHLWWRTNKKYHYNLVSWTSSLLFALQLMRYRHIDDGSPLGDIRLFVVDTTLFPRGTFMRDLDLIDAFAVFEVAEIGNGNARRKETLSSLANLRKHDYYFGEYLSQGALKIEGKCQILPASAIFDGDRLDRIQPAFTGVEGQLLAKVVCKLRKTIWTNNPSSRITREQMHERMRAVREIIDNFEPAWRLPLAIYFAALVGPQSEIQDLGATENAFFTLFKECWVPPEGPAHFRVVAPNSMPELKRVDKILLEVYEFHLQLVALGSQTVLFSAVTIFPAETVIGDFEIIKTRLCQFKDAYRSLNDRDAMGRIEVLVKGDKDILNEITAIQALCEQVSQALDNRKRQ